MLKLQFLALGSELLSGHVLETNAHWLEQQLRNREAKVQRVTVLPDHFDNIVTTIQKNILNCDILIVCGGLGPTDDDLTREAIAKAAGVELSFSSQAWHEIEDFFKARQRTPSPSNRRQAFAPQGATIISNSCGTAPGIDIQLGNCRVLAFPGVPTEFKAMCQQSLLKDIPALPAGPQFKLWGIGESNLMDLLMEHKVIPQGVEWGTIARAEGITVHFNGEITQRPDGESILKHFESVCQNYIYTQSHLSPVQLLCETIKSQNLSLGTAESCTGGLLSSWITAQSGSSDYFMGSIVSYANTVKQSVLRVPKDILEVHGAVSEPCALAMAKGALQALDCEVALSITGIAGPSGGTADKPVGTVYYAVAHCDGRQLCEVKRFSGSREDVRERSAYAVCLLALKLLKA
jgi:nicotinamide-nucleotide amidase